MTQPRLRLPPPWRLALRALLFLALLAFAERAQAQSYSVSAVPYQFTEVSGVAGATTWTNCDDCVYGPYAIPFAFTYYGSSYTQVWISSNGFLMFGPTTGPYCCAGAAIPNATDPNNYIAGYWTDLINGTLGYATTGTAPNRVFTVEWNTNFYNNATPVKVEAQLYEGSNNFYINIASVGSDTHTGTIGFEDATGSSGYQVWNGASYSGSGLSYKATLADTTPPTVPGTPSVSPNPAAGAVTVSWAPSSDASGIAAYDLQVSTNGGSTWTTVASPAINSYSYSPGQGSYLFHVRARDPQGNASAFSASSATLTVDTTAPSVPGTPSAAPNPSTGAVSVSWAASTDTGGAAFAAYDLQVSSDGGATWSALASPTTNSYAYTAAQGSFLYRVRARDTVGNASAYSANSAAEIVDTTAPTVPGTPSISPNPANNIVQLTWSASTDAGGSNLAAYDVQVSSDGGGTWSTLASPATNTYSYTAAQGSYLYRVRARDGAGNASAYGANSVAGVVDTTAPSVPGTPSATPNPSSGTVTVSWAASSDTGGANLAAYDLQVSGDGGATWNTLVSQAATSYGYTAAQGSYLYRVRARDNAGNASSYSANSAAEIVDTTAPTAPGTPSVTPNPSSGALTVTWTASSETGGANLAAYDLQVSADGGATWSTLASPTTNSFSYTAAQGSYRFHVRARDNAGNASVYSANSAAVIVDTTAPSVPGTPSAAPNSSGTVTLSWNASTDTGGAGLAAYDLQVSSDGGATWSTLASPTTNGFTTSAAQGSYVYRVRARDTVGNASAYSANSAAEIVDTTAPSVPGTPVPSPNPSLGTVSVTWPASSDTGGSGLASYDLQVSSNGGSTWSTLASPTTNGFTYTAPQGSYVYRVLARDNAGNASAYGASSAAETVDTTAPGVPGKPVATPNPANGLVTITWFATTDTGGSNLAAYDLLESPDNGASWLLLVSQTTTSYTWLPAQGSHLLRVRARDTAGNSSAWAVAASALVVDTTAPTVPGTPTATPGSSGTIAVSWGASTDAGGSGVANYLVEQSPNGGSTWTQVGTPAGASFTAQVSAGTYVYRVRARDLAGNVSAYSAQSAGAVQSTSAPTPPWANGYAYRKALSLQSTAGALSDYQVLALLDTLTPISQGHLRSDCADMRVVAADGVTRVPFFVESGCNTSATRVWIRAASVPSTVYWYYGNGAAPSASSPDQTFLLYEDAEGTRTWTGAGLWRKQQCFAPATTSWGYQSGACNSYQTSGANSGTLDSPSFTLPAGARLFYTDKSGTQDAGGPLDSPAFDREAIQLSTDGGATFQTLQTYGGTWDWTDRSVDLSALSGTSARLRFSFDTVDGNDNAHLGWYLDTIVVRKTAAQEPTASAASEESLVTQSGSPQSWNWRVPQPGDRVKSGTAQDWNWVAFQDDGTVVRVPRGSAASWAWDR